MSKTEKKTPPPVGKLLADCPLSKLKPAPDNPRGVINENDPAVLELAASIKARGLIQPITATKDLVVIGGHRRRVAAKLAGLKAVPVLVYAVDDETAREMRVVENLQREDLAPMDEARGVAALLAAGHKPSEIADRLGKPLGWVVRRAKITELSPSWKKLAARKDAPLAGWTAGMLEEVASLPVVSQEALFEEVGRAPEMFSAERLKEMALDLRRALAQAPFDIRDEKLIPKVGSCLACPKRASCTPGLFAEVGEVEPGKLPKNDLCLDAGCFTKKRFALLARKVEELQAGGEKVILTVNYSDRRALPKPLSDLIGETYGFERCGKTHPGALASLDSETLKVSYFIKPGRASATKAASDSEAPPTKTLEQKRESLALKRAIWAADHLLEQLDGKLPMPEPAEIFALAAVFGFGRNEEDPQPDQPLFGTEGRVPFYDDFPGEPDANFVSQGHHIAAVIWPRLKISIVAQLRGWRLDALDSSAAIRAEWTANLILEGGWAGLLALAAEAKPEPRSWPKTEQPAKKAS